MLIVRSIIMKKNVYFTVFFSTFLILFSYSIIYSQSINEIKANSSLYLWGEGKGNTLKSADQSALAEIIGQISVAVESKFSRLVTETNGNLNEFVYDVINTYSTASLNNAERIIISNEPDAIVFRFIKRSEIIKIFESRKNKIIDLAQSGEKALENVRISDALRCFYWSQTLLRSHPYSSEIKMTNNKGKEILLISWLPEQINEILSDLKFELERFEPTENYSFYYLNIKYKNISVGNLDYSYWSGQDWSNLYSAKDGLGVIELNGTEMVPEIRVKIEYAFENEANVDMELRDVIKKLPEVPYRKSYLSFKTNIKREEFAKKINFTNQISKFTEVSDSILYSNIIAKVVMSLSKSDYTSIKQLFTDEGFSVYEKLLQYGKAKVIKIPKLKFIRFEDYIIVRSIPMSFNFENSLKSFTESVVFYFDADNKICNLSFGLEDRALSDIFKNIEWGEDIRTLLVCFLENYKTAFALKRFDYINKIFSDEALIITGYVTKPTAQEQKFFDNSIVRYNRQSKSDYMKKLKYSFNSKEYINIRFAENIIRKSGKNESVYGIQIKQDYYSSNYGDSGYLFLMIDFKDSLNPLIHVRTWQPQRNADGSIYGLSDF